MSRILPAADICAQALGAINAWPVTETAPDPDHLRRAMTWLDLIMAEVVGTQRLFSRVNATIDVPLTNGTQNYDLYATLGSSLPTDGIEFVVDAWLEDSTGNRTPLEIVTRQKFEDVPLLAETGKPCRIYFEITPASAPILRIFPTPATTDTQAYTIKLVGQRYAPNVAPSGVTGTTSSGTVLHDMGAAYQRWLIWQLAHDLGSGPIHKLPEASLSRFAGTALNAKAKLDAFENRPHETTAPVCEPWGM